MSTKKIDDMTDRGNYDLSPFGACDRYSDDCLWRVTFRRAWNNYGGRGIAFCFESFEQFFAELGPKPGPGYSVDRIDNEGHYEPGNVRWATRSEQRANQRPRRRKGQGADTFAGLITSGMEFGCPVELVERAFFEATPS